MGCEYHVLFTCGEVRPLSQTSCWAALLELSYCVGVQILRKKKIPSILSGHCPEVKAEVSAGVAHLGNKSGDLVLQEHRVCVGVVHI